MLKSTRMKHLLVPIRHRDCSTDRKITYKNNKKFSTATPVHPMSYLAPVCNKYIRMYLLNLYVKQPTICAKNDKNVE